MTTCQQSACHELIIWRLVGLHTFDVYSDFSLLIKTNQLSFCSPIHPGSDVACWLKTFFFLLLIIFYTLYIHIFIFWSIFTECYRNEINKLNKQINKKKKSMTSLWCLCSADNDDICLVLFRRTCLTRCRCCPRYVCKHLSWPTFCPARDGKGGTGVNNDTNEVCVQSRPVTFTGMTYCNT